MNSPDDDRTREQLLDEVRALRERVAALERDAQAHAGLVEAAPDAMLLVAADGRIVRANDQAERLFGYSRDELLRRGVEELVPERFRARHIDDRAHFVAENSTRPMGAGRELFARRKDGSEVPVEISLSPLDTDAGRLVIATVRDVTERKKSEARLRRAEARFQSLVENIPAVTFMAALTEGAVNELYVSPQIEALLGFTAREWLEDPVLWYRQLHPDDRARWNTEFAPTVAFGRPFSSVYRFVARDGRVVWVRGEARVEKDEDGRPLFLQGVAFDITAIKQAQEELRLHNQRLEDAVREATAKVEQRVEELRQANARLVGYGKVTYHDLSKPLRSITSFTKLLAPQVRQHLDDEARDHIGRALSAAENMQILLKSFWD
jgi:PAS domain S-box-containing protein